MLALPSQTPGVPERYELTRAQLEAEAWVITRAQRKLSGARAINAVWRELGGFWGGVATFFGHPLFIGLESALYRLVAKNRHALSRIWSATPECERHGIKCD